MPVAITLSGFQIALIVAVGAAIGWHVTSGIFAAVGLLLLGTIAFAGIGMLMAGVHPGTPAVVAEPAIVASAGTA